MTEPQEQNTPQPPLPPEEDDGNLSLIGEFIVFLKENKKWWLIPLIVMVGGLTLLVIAGSSQVLAPFIYSLF